MTNASVAFFCPSFVAMTRHGAKCSVYFLVGFLYLFIMPRCHLSIAARACVTKQTPTASCRSLIELCCDPDSNLSELAPLYGVEAFRMTRERRFDLDRGLQSERLKIGAWFVAFND